LELCDRIAEEIDRRIVAESPEMRTSSAAAEEATGTGNALTLSVFKVPRRGKWDHFADFTIRCRQTGPGRYAIEIYCDVTLTEAKGEAIRFGPDRISDTLREYRAFGVAASETTHYRRGIRQLGEGEDEVVSRHLTTFTFKVTSAVQRLDRVEAGNTVKEIGELALARLEAMKKIRENPKGRLRVGLKQESTEAVYIPKRLRSK